MKILTFTLLFLGVFSTHTPAQQLSTGNILQPVRTIEHTTNNLTSRLNKDPVLAPFALSNLPSIETVVTQPLNSLPKSLAITSSNQEQLWIDVEVENGWRAVQRQWMILADHLGRKTLVEHGAVIIAQTSYPGLGLTLLRFNVPSVLDSKQALAAILPADSLGSLARNHIYQSQNKITQQVTSQDITQENQSLKRAVAVCEQKVKVGLVDGAIDLKHNAFKNANIRVKSFLPSDLNASLHHGTAITSLLVGNNSQLTPLLPKGEIYSAQVFYQQSNFAQGATLSAIIAGVNWLIEQKVNVINMSLAGPENQVLHKVLNAAMAKGAYVVAAAGNEGPAAPAMYPAAYQGVIAVSAIDLHQQPYRWSNRGDYVDYSAVGVNVLTAQSDQQVGRESGTSISAPRVSATLACLTLKYGKNKQDLLNNLSELSVDLGPKGKDPIFGIGALM